MFKKLGWLALSFLLALPSPVLAQTSGQAVIGYLSTSCGSAPSPCFVQYGLNSGGIPVTVLNTQTPPYGVNIVGPTTTPVASSSLESCHTLKNAAGVLYNVSLSVQGTSGYFVLLNQTSAPSPGAITPIWSQPVQSNGTSGGGSWGWLVPKQFSTGIEACFTSASTPFTYTSSSTAMISGDVL